MRSSAALAAVALFTLTTEALVLPRFFQRRSDGGAFPAGFIAEEASKNASHQSGGDHYVVIFNNSQSTQPHAAEVLSRIGLSPNHSDVVHIYNNSAFRGFSANMKSHCIEALTAMDDVAFVTQSVAVSTRQNVLAEGSSPWGLQRISSSSTVQGNPEDLEFTYTHDANDLGSGVDIYVVDTGINTAHEAFGGRAVMGWTYNSSLDTDGDGHGTHVSGTAAGMMYGVAQAANLIGVKVLDDTGSGTTANSIAGIDWVVQQHDAKKGQTGFVGSIMSMSWGLTTISSDIDNAISSSVTSAGIHAIVAAGNQAGDSCAMSPSSVGGTQGPAIAVGSVGISNAISSFSNTGACTDVYAPGEDVISAWIGGDTVVNVLDGTSMATPHVTGVVAYLMKERPDLAADPAAMKQEVISTALQGVVTGSPQSGDAMLLLNNGITGTVSRRRGVSDAELREARDVPGWLEKARRSVEPWWGSAAVQFGTVKA